MKVMKPVVTGRLMTYLSWQYDDFKPDLVLLDYILPGINGSELARS